MMTSKNIQAQESQYVEGVRMLFKGLSMMFGTVAEGMEGGAPTTQVESKAAPAAPKAEPTVAPTAAPTAPAPAETKAPAPAETGGKPITRTDVQRAMAAKIKELSAKGSSPDAVGTLFPQFHGASCVSDLTADDYPAFLAELAKL